MVVDIFSSKGSHMPFSRMLPDVLEELGIFALHFVFLCGILFLVKRFRSRLLALSAAFLMPFFQLFFVWKVSIHSEVFLSVALPDPASGPDPIPYGGSPVPFCCFSVSGKAVQFHLRPAGASLAVLADLLYISYSCQTEPSQPPGEPVFLLSLVCGPVCFRLWIFPGHPFCRSLFPEGLWKPCAGACRRHRAVSAFGSRSCLAFCAIVWGMPWKG